jgi:steroid delta-isomerase-like uncharacterized protein
MSLQENLNLERKIIDSFNHHNLKEAEQYVDEKCQFIDVPFNMKGQGLDGFRQFVGGWEKAFPDSKMVVTNMIGNDDTVVIEFTGTGTHRGPLVTPQGEIPPTGKHVEIPFTEIDKIRNGKVVESKIYYDALTMLQQVGVVNKKDLLPHTAKA